MGKSQENTFRKQCAVLWRFHSFKSDGTPKVMQPEQIRVRLESDAQEEDKEQYGVITRVCKLAIFCDIPANSIIREGTLDDLEEGSDKLLIVKKTKSIPDIKGRHSRKTIVVKTFGDTLPEVVTE